jgi:hypothetical protein
MEIKEAYLSAQNKISVIDITGHVTTKTVLRIEDSVAWPC